MVATERTLILLKPDALERGLCGEILRRFERAGLRLVQARMVRFTRPLLTRHYAELRLKHPRAFARNATYLVGRHVAALVLEGSNAVAKCRALVGPTDPLSAPAGTIRGDWSADSIAVADAADRGLFNLVHAADSPVTARREIRLWFGQKV
jgi:nucleoside-diphosphate kinase